ncbi:hypothetical protein A3H38_03880 [candidate division WOR-1 bacterium RIFCSPLOWO2_02_FULL_46_20]|uniref:Polymerase beta nucleotidyltransferase domain-containing protein n=2 Tax=Saganbacteria TaxID=1703751 RepID=A0A1F4RFP0_UNCSA|nr:MAG: hypothetical protein A3H38_03880 [candidate division WOR-1 bacterium RIFCSPLOWO2_02_FULL_46_20]OGC07985.1 MAG: hypothetical protein A3F86_05975 [candidate division WOR-1 bacterium RIFCSPLOWO2_12_FULL_45_9]
MVEIDYRKLWAARFAKEAEDKQTALETLRKAASQAAQILADQFQAKKIYLFGSVKTPAFFHEASDVDLAVEGIAPKKYFPALAKIMGLFGGRRVDLVPLEDAPPLIEKKIKETGEVLYG